MDNRNVSSSELNDFIREYEKIKDLKEKYDSGKYNRKELANEIIENVNKAMDLIEVFKIDLYSGRSKYIYTNYISDYYIILYALLKIANNGKTSYILKKLRTKENKQEKNIWLIGDNEILKRFNENSLIDSRVFKHIIVDIINSGFSIVMITNSESHWDIIPENNQIKNADIRKFKVDAFSNLCCYTYDDELALAVDKLSKYIEIYGGDIDNIAIDTVVSNIDNINNEKMLIKRK